MPKRVCATLDSYKRLAAFAKFEATKLKGAPYEVLAAVDKAWDIEEEIFEISIPNTKAGAALKLQNVLDLSHGSDDPLPPAFVSSLRKLKKLLEKHGKQKQLRGRAKTVEALLQQVNSSLMAGMVRTVLAAIELDYCEFGEPGAGAKVTRRRAVR